MINSVSMSGFTPVTGTKARPVQKNITSNNITNPVGIIAEKNEGVYIDGKVYKVQKVSDNGSFLKSIMPKQKEAVVIDGKQYDVKTVSDPLACDKTKKVVVVDGKQYNVQDVSGLELINAANELKDLFGKLGQSSKEYLG